MEEQKKAIPRIPWYFRGITGIGGYHIFTLARVIQLPNFLIRKRLDENHANNSALRVEFPLVGQGLGELKKFRIGRHNFHHSGCGCIALFNTLSMMGQKPNLCEIVEFVEKKGMLAYGLMGTNPKAVEKYLRLKGVAFQRFLRMDELQEAIQPDDVIISLYWWTQPKSIGAHYVSLRADETGLTAYNVFGNRDIIYHYDTVADFMQHIPNLKPIVWYLMRKEE